MSIRNSPQLSPHLLDAARCNARRSHGPRTAAGKENSKMNGVKHGERSAPENHYEVMRALGEDPAQFEALKQELRDSFGPGNAFFDMQVDDLAQLYWRRDRLERMEGGLAAGAALRSAAGVRRKAKKTSAGEGAPGAGGRGRCLAGGRRIVGSGRAGREQRGIAGSSGLCSPESPGLCGSAPSGAIAGTGRARRGPAGGTPVPGTSRSRGGRDRSRGAGIRVRGEDA